MFLLAAVAGQEPSSIILVRGKVWEQVGLEREGLRGAVINVPDYGQFSTDTDGKFAFKFPLDQPYLRLEILPDFYRLMDPRGGLIELSPNSPVLTLDVVVVGKRVSEDLKRSFVQLEKKIKKLETEGVLSQARLNALNRQMLDTILFFEREKAMMQREMEKLRQDLDRSLQSEAELNRKLISYERVFVRLRDSVDQLTVQLFQALEEKYLRQQQLINAFTANFSAYQSSLLDIRDVLRRCKEYFRTYEGLTAYNDHLVAYSNIRDELNRDRQGHVTQCRHYFAEQPYIFDLVEQIYTYVLQDIHDRTVLRIQEEVNGPLRKTPPKTNRAIHAAEDILIQLEPAIEKLNRYIEELDLALLLIE